uniref:Uncharacterized protein n=1 Tax=Peronospora matthiolae TaxID=2874970 RepID=A0AAV1TUX0_9STRA
MGVCFLLFALSLCFSLFAETVLAHVVRKVTLSGVDGPQFTAGHTSNGVHPSMDVTAEERTDPSGLIKLEVVPLLHLSPDQTKIYASIAEKMNLNSAYSKLMQEFKPPTKTLRPHELMHSQPFIASDYLPAFRKRAHELHNAEADAEVIRFLETRHGSRHLALSLREASKSVQEQVRKAAEALQAAQFKMWRDLLVSDGDILKVNEKDFFKVKLGVVDFEHPEEQEKGVMEEFMTYMERSEKEAIDAKLMQ